jgi:DNA end-binding protein Ku
MALTLIEGVSGKCDPKKYKDSYTNALRSLVRAKLKGNEIHRAPEAEPEEAPDLMEALRMSVEQVQRGRVSTRRRRAATRKSATPRVKSKSKE